MQAPYGSMPGFSIDTEMRYIASYYRLRPRTLKRNDGRHGERVAEARAALCWRLHIEKNIDAARVGELLGITERAVRYAVDAHKQRILEFHRDAMLKPPPREQS